MIIKFIIDGIDYTKHSTLPIQEGVTADESLDNGYIELKALKESQPFKPYTKCVVHKKDETKEIKYYYYIASDEVEEIIQKGLFNHNIVLVEETKEFERYMVDSMTVRHPIVHDFITASCGAYIEKRTVFQTSDTTENYYSEVLKDLYTTASKLPSLQSVLGATDAFMADKSVTWFLTLTDADGNGVAGSGGITTEFIPNQELSVGNYTIQYGYMFGSGTDIYMTYLTASFTVIAQSLVTHEDYTIKDVCEKLLAICETLRESETPKFVLADAKDYDEEFVIEAQKLLSLKSPEFTFTKCTLFEALKEVGDYIHAIPRLKQGKVFFDMLGVQNETTADLSKYISHSQSQQIDKFCSELDANVENLLNTDNEKQGSVIEPSGSIYKTVRVESGVVQITEDEIIIATDYPIYNIVKLEAGFMNNDNTLIGDITPYVYESAEYNSLSSYDEFYPTSKMYALKFTQGQKNITELNFKKGSLMSSISPAFENYAICNILYRKLGKTTSWWSNFWDNTNVLNLQFRITYIPMVSTRVKQVKANVCDLQFKSVLAYNQSANMVSSNAFGENLKGAVAKYGVASSKKMYIFKNLDNVPKINTKYGELCITSIKTETFSNHIKAEIEMSKKFNNQSSYIDINSQKRYYSVTEKSCSDRHVLYEDYCIIGNQEESDGKSLITSLGVEKFVEMLNASNGIEGCEVSNVKAQGVSGGVNFKEVALPVISLGMGNSILLTFAYKDNFSAGDFAKVDKDTKYQEYLAYGDNYGELNTLQVRFGNGTQMEGENMKNYSTSVTLGDAVPKGESLTDSYFHCYFSTNDDLIVLKKDGGERIIFTYQMHFVTNRQNLIIGSGFGRKNTFTTEEALNYKLYVLPNKINEFEKTVDLTGATEFTLSVESNGTQRIKIQDITPNVSGKAWVIVNSSENAKDLIFGENINVNDGEVLTLPFLTFKRNIRN